MLAKCLIAWAEGETGGDEDEKEIRAVNSKTGALVVAETMIMIRKALSKRD